MGFPYLGKLPFVVSSMYSGFRMAHRPGFRIRVWRSRKSCMGERLNIEKRHLESQDGYAHEHVGSVLDIKYPPRCPPKRK